MCRPHQERLDQRTQNYMGPDQDVQTRLEQTRPKCTDPNKTRPRWTDHIQLDQTKEPRPTWDQTKMY